jgi:DNA excision repair protein ERCC-2
MRSSYGTPGGVWLQGSDQLLANPLVPADILHEAVPGNIRRAEHFVMFLKRLVEYLKQRMLSQQVGFH